MDNSELLVFRSKDCIAEPLVYERPIDSVTDKLITKMLISKKDRVVEKEGKFYYTPSEEYIKHVAQIKRFKYLSA